MFWLFFCKKHIFQQVGERPPPPDLSPPRLADSIFHILCRTRVGLAEAGQGRGCRILQRAEGGNSAKGGGGSKILQKGQGGGPLGARGAATQYCDAAMRGWFVGGCGRGRPLEIRRREGGVFLFFSSGRGRVRGAFGDGDWFCANARAKVLARRGRGASRGEKGSPLILGVASRGGGSRGQLFARRRRLVSPRPLGSILGAAARLLLGSPPARRISSPSQPNLGRCKLPPPLRAVGARCPGRCWGMGRRFVGARLFGWGLSLRAESSLRRRLSGAPLPKPPSQCYTLAAQPALWASDRSGLAYWASSLGQEGRLSLALGVRLGAQPRE